MAGHVVKVSVVADTKQFAKTFRSIKEEAGLDRLAGAAKEAAATLAKVGAAAATAVGGIVAKGVSMAADLEQSIGSVEAVFKENAGQVAEWSKKSATALGITRNDYNELATLIGSQLKNAGVAMDELGPKTNDLIGLGADLSAMFGGTTKEAVEAISSALKGERDPIEKYGVSLKQAAIDAKAAEMGFTKVGNSFSNEAQAAATMALIMEQTSDAHGAFGRETDTLAHQIQVLKAQLKDAWTQLGMYFLPIVTRVVKFLSDNFQPAAAALASIWQERVVPRLKDAADVFQTSVLPVLQSLYERVVQNVVPAVIRFAQAAGETLMPIIREIPGFLKDWGPAIIGGVAAFETMTKVAEWFNNLKTAVNAAKTAFNALKVAFATNPIGLVVIAVAALVAGFVYLFQHSEAFRASVQQVWEQIKTGAAALAEWFTTTLLPTLTQWWEQLKAVFQAGWDFLKATWETIGKPVFDILMTVVDGIAQHWGEIWNGIMTVVSGVWQAISGIISGALDVIEGVLNVFTGILTLDWGKTWDGIKSIVSGAWSIIKGVVGGAIDVVKGVISGGMGLIKGVWSGAWNGIKSFLSTAWNGIKNGVTTGISNVVSTIRGLPGKAMSALGNIGSTLLNAGKNLIQGFLNGINSAFNRVKSRLKQLTSWLPSWKGPADVDARLLQPAGTLIIKGLIKGLESQYGNVRDSLGHLTGIIGGTDLGALNVAGLTGTVPLGTQVFAPTINVHALNATDETGRMIQNALDEWQISNAQRTAGRISA